MKKIISVIIIIGILFTLSVSAFADDEEKEVTFETLYEGQLPEYTIDATEFEAGVNYVLYVSTPRSQEPFDADEGHFEGVRGTIVKKDIVCVNAEIIKIEEDDNFDYIITFTPKEEGEFSFEILMRTFGFDIIYDDYRTINGDDWVYTIKTDSYTATPYTGTVSFDDSSSVESGNVQSSADASSQASTSSGSTASVITVDVDNEGGISVWVWVVIGVAVVACVAVGVVFYRKKLIK